VAVNSIYDVPTFEDFLGAAKSHTLLGVGVSLNFDHETPIALAARFAHLSHFFLLESAASGPGSVARYSFLGFDRLWSIAGVQKRHEFCDATTRTIKLSAVDPLDALRAHMKTQTFSWLGAQLSQVEKPPVPGAVGLLSYDIASLFEPSVGKAPPAEFGLPESCFVMPEKYLVFDHLFRRLTVAVLVDLNQTPPTMALYDKTIETLSEVLSTIARPIALGSLTARYQPPDFEGCRSSFPEQDFLASAKKCLNYIRAGDIYQIQIGNRLTLKTDEAPLNVFRFLRMLNPSPYMFFFRYDRHHVLGASPEMMVQVISDHITQRPIAGTRKRYLDYEKDQLMRRELAESEKERSEHLMLVDLSRNDVGRIAQPGSVCVDELMSIEEYSHVFHMVSQVSGRILDKYDAYDAMRVSFPNGTVCGAPKIKAMQIINQLEPCSREFYAGSLAMFGCDGSLRSTILIRTIYMAEGIAATQASAGIVYDSIPEQEWQETRNKMAACVAAMQQHF